MSHEFITRHGWNAVKTLPQDGTLRTYTRIEKNGKTALFMDCGPLEGIVYITRLSEFIRIGNWLRSIGVHTPEIYEADEAANVAIIEDFGDISMKNAMQQGLEKRITLYRSAADILDQIKTDCPLKLQTFWDSPMRARRMRLVDWYIPALRRQTNPGGLRQSYHEVWEGIENSLDRPEEGFMHVDFHAENLMYLGNGKLGVIDFQEGLVGPYAYDMVNLLEDMRTDVPEDIQAELMKDKDENFRAWCRVLGTQFHMRLMGQCVRWAIAENKPHFMTFLPRLENYIKRALKDPVLKPVKQWCDEEGLDFDSLKDFNPDEVRKYIAQDAL